MILAGHLVLFSLNYKFNSSYFEYCNKWHFDDIWFKRDWIKSLSDREHFLDNNMV